MSRTCIARTIAAERHRLSAAEPWRSRAGVRSGTRSPRRTWPPRWEAPPHSLQNATAVEPIEAAPFAAVPVSPPSRGPTRRQAQSAHQTNRRPHGHQCLRKSCCCWCYSCRRCRRER